MVRRTRSVPLLSCAGLVCVPCCMTCDRMRDGTYMYEYKPEAAWPLPYHVRPCAFISMSKIVLRISTCCALHTCEHAPVRYSYRDTELHVKL